VKSNYWKIVHAGMTTPNDVFPFDGDDFDDQARAATAANRAVGPSGRVVAFRRPRYGDFEGGIVGEVNEYPRAPQPRWFGAPRRDLERNGGLS
jgi:hypothetical protein